MPLISKAGLSKFPEVAPVSDIVRGTGLFGFPQAMFNLSQKVSSPSPDAPECSSPIVVSEKSVALPKLGDCEVGSGEVPQDELGPWLEFDEAEGELYDVLWPVLPLPFAESVFNLDALELF